ncbi:hypothetical protein ACOMHN_016729 [Nucella lapillus]
MWSEGEHSLQAGPPTVMRRANSWRELGTGGTNTFGVPVDPNWLSNYGNTFGAVGGQHHHPTGQVLPVCLIGDSWSS